MVLEDGSIHSGVMGPEVIKEGMLLKRKDYLPKWDKRLFVIEMDMDAAEKDMQLTIKFYIHSGGKPVKTKSLYGTKIKLSDAKSKSDSGRFDLIFQDGDRYRLNATDQFDRQDWIDEIVTLLQDFSEDPLDMDDIIENNSVTSKDDIESSLTGSLRSPRQSDADEEQRKARAGNLHRIASGMEYAEVQDTLNKRIKGRSKSQREKLVKREQSKKRLERTLSSLSGSKGDAGSDLRRNSFRNSSREKRVSRQNSIREEIEPGSPRDLMSPASNPTPTLPRRRPSRGPSLLNISTDLLQKPSSVPTSPGRSSFTSARQSPRLLDALESLTDKQAQRTKRVKSDVGSRVRKSISGRTIPRLHDASAADTPTRATPTPSQLRDGAGSGAGGGIRSALKDKNKPARRRTVHRGVSFSQKANAAEAQNAEGGRAAGRSNSVKVPRLGRSSSLRQPPTISEKVLQDQDAAAAAAAVPALSPVGGATGRSMVAQDSLAEPLFGQQYFMQQERQKQQHSSHPSQAVPLASPRTPRQDVDMPARGKKWNLLKNVLHLMPNTNSSDKVKEFIFGDISQDARMSYEVPAINGDVNELDLFAAVPDTSSLMVASVHEQYLRAKEFVNNSEASLQPEQVSKYTSYNKMIDSLKTEAPAAAIAAQSYYSFEVTKSNPYWCATGVDGAAMRVGFASPQAMIVELLRRPTLLNLMMLKECMSYSGPEWVQMFYKLQGSEALFEVVGLHMGILKQGQDDAIDAILQALLCLQALIASERGMELAIADSHFVAQLLLVLELDETESDVHKLLTIIMLQSIMLYDGDGYHRVLESVLQPKLTETIIENEHHDDHENSDKENFPMDLSFPLPSLNLDDMSNVKIPENDEFLDAPQRTVSSITKLKINASCVRTLVGLLDSDKNDLDMDLCVHVIKFLQAMLATAETLEERKLRKQLVHALVKCEIYGVLELITTDLDWVDNTAVQNEIDDLKLQITAVVNEIIEDVDEEEIDISDEPSRQIESKLSLKPHEARPAAARIPPPPPLPANMSGKLRPPATPPPPVPKKGGPPAPPPGGMEAKYSGPKPHLKMKSLFWDKIPPARLKGTFWEQFSKGGYENVDFKEVEKLFQAMVRRGAAGGMVGKSLSKKLKVLDIKRATTIGILLNKFPVPWHKIKYTAISLDSSIYTCADDVHALLDCLPKEEEAKKIEAFIKSGASHDGLSEAELVCIDLYQIPRAEERLRTFYSMFVSLDRLSEVTKILEAHSQAMRQLQTSRVMRVVLQMILALGNFMNYGTRLGNAMGFRLKCLSKLQDTRSLDGKHSLLSYIAQQVCKSGYPILSDEIPSLVRAELKTCLKDVNEMFSSVKEAISLIETELEEQPTRVFVVFDLDYSAYNFQSTPTPRQNSVSTSRSLEDITEASENSGGSSGKEGECSDMEQTSNSSTPVPSVNLPTASNSSSNPAQIDKPLQSQDSQRTPRKMADIFAMWQEKSKQVEDNPDDSTQDLEESTNSASITTSDLQKIQKGDMVGEASSSSLEGGSDRISLSQEDQLRLERLDASTYVQVDLLVDNYQGIMGESVTEIKRKLKHLSDKLKTCITHFERLLAFYGEKLTSINEEDFWSAVISFVERLSQHQRGAYRDLKEEIERRKRSLRRQLDSGKIEGRALSEMETAMSHVLQQQGVTDLDAQVEAIMIQEFGIERLSLGTAGPEASKRAMLMRVFANGRKELEKDTAAEEKKDKLRRASESALQVQDAAEKKAENSKGVSRRRTIREGSLLNKGYLTRALMKSKSSKTSRTGSIEEQPGMEQHLNLMSIEEPQESPKHQRSKTDEAVDQVELGSSPSDRNHRFSDARKHVKRSSMGS